MDDLVFFINRGLVGSLVIGSIYALGAVGVTLIFGILRFAHFAHGDMMTAGAFFTLILASVLSGLGVGGPLPLALLVLPLSMILTAGFAVGLDRLFYRPLRERGARPVVMVMASIGVALMLQGLIRLFAGTGSWSLALGAPKTIFRIPTGGRPIVVTEPQVALFLATAVLVTALHVFLTRSRLGVAMRAVADDPALARVTGIPISRVVAATWIIGGGLAAVAGTLLALDVELRPDLAYNLLLPIFAAAILGGIGQPYGAVAGGFVVGFAETLAVFNFSTLLRPLGAVLPAGWELPANLALVPNEYRLVVPFVILVAVLIYRPTGIFRGRVFA
ncbi:branched-chain amino acid ABC transporter permease [Aureimonas sp. AU4]|uniref:branched-chain amino acid ABC transporter permease n=1 Tax=Aureimonas sp. AU4 TaxID=1638163 RepID=UPI00078670B0|nr:branched-chain amino acid ABC transporter permease [Aureimonas sp. AU4]